MVRLNSKPQSISETFILDMIYRVKFQKKWVLIDQSPNRIVFRGNGSKSILIVSIVIGADGLIWVNLLVKSQHKMAHKELVEIKELFFGLKLNAYQKIVTASEIGVPPNVRHSLWACLEGQQIPDFDVD